MAIATSAFVGIFGVAPTSTNFTLKAYDFGNGGGSGSSSSYNLNGTTGIQTGTAQSSSNFGLNPGEQPTQNANVPPAATLSNPSDTYNKLRLILNTGSNPTDTRFAIAISSNDFVSTQYIQSDNSIGSTLGIEDHQTYAQWGGATGFDVLGLVANTSYKVRVSALQGNFTGSAFGPASAGVATTQPSITFGVATSLSPTPPFSLGFASLAPNTVFSANASASVTISSNAVFGGGFYVRGTNTGLTSPSKGFTLASTSADLSVAATGYGGQVSSASQTSGGPLAPRAPYNGVSNTVGALSMNLQQVASSPGPIVGGAASVVFKAKAATATPAADDYSDRLTFVASMLF